MQRNKTLKALAFVAALAGTMWVSSCSKPAKEETAAETDSVPPAAAPAVSNLTLPQGFTASIIADGLSKPRHLSVTPQGNIFVKLGEVKDGKGVVMLDGTGAVKGGFGDYEGTGIYIKNGYLYASSNTSIFRYKLNENNEVAEGTQPETIVSGLVDHDQHNSKSIVLDNDGNIYVNIGAFSNACQEKDRTKGSKGMKPCPVLDSAGGIWKFKADKAGQTFKDGKRYATGLRNVVGLDWNQETNKLFVMQHGRDQLSNLYPEYYNDKQSAELPAECMYELKDGSNCGWPYIYVDPTTKKKMVGPEYGGDGKKESKEYQDPAAVYPAHLAPNGLLFYTGTQFPEKYKNGAFIAFHGSWNRAPEPQAGYFVVFQPFANGKPSGDFEVFADNFSGSQENTQGGPGKVERRPCGLAQGPDGSLYVTDDKKGAIFKISYGK